MRFSSKAMRPSLSRLLAGTEELMWPAWVTINQGYLVLAIGCIQTTGLRDRGVHVAEPKGLKKPVKLQPELAARLGVKALPRTEMTKQLWAYIKANKLQTKTADGKPENAGKFIVPIWEG